MKIMSGVYWNCGKRTSNEDSVTLQQVMTGNGRVLLAAVSDGIGGLSEGQNASGYILEKLVENFYKQMIGLVNCGRSVRMLEKSLLRCFYEMNADLNRYAVGRNIRLGATISLLFLWKKRYLIFHLGDSRIYLYRKKKMQLLTKDHSNGGTGLTRCMGSFGFQTPDILAGKLQSGSGFLLCTDGFYGPLSMEKTGEILSPADISMKSQIEKRLEQLGKKALENGGRDNLSAVYLVID